jgi:hypothetical protein
LHHDARLAQNLIGLQGDGLQIGSDSRVFLRRQATQDAILERICRARSVGQDLLLGPV